MINHDAFQKYLAKYKNAFQKNWKAEKYKWEAIQHFQKYWDLEAENFADMLNKALAKTYNLLASGFAYPKAMLVYFAELNPETTRSAMRNLFDESKPVADRVEAFIAFAEDQKENHNADGWKNHYQDLHAISVYLWLRFPDRYSIYKYKVARDAAKALGSDYIPKRTSDVDNLIKAYAMYDEIASLLRADEEISNMVNQECSSIGCSDSMMYTTASDFGFYIAVYNPDEEKEEWFPDINEYNPGLSLDKWLELLHDPEIFTENDLKIVARFYDAGGAATCKELSVRYGESPNFYNGGSSALGKRIAEKTGCPMNLRDNANARYWPILYVGKHATKEQAGAYIWKLRDELCEALKQMDLTGLIPSISKPGVPGLKEGGDSEMMRRYWWLTANPKIWSFSALPIGSEQTYTLYNDNGHKRRIHQNFLDARVGDVVIGYESTPVKQIVAIARITREQNGTDIAFEKVEGLTVPIDYVTLQNCPELATMEYFINPQGSLFKLTENEYEFIMDVIRDENPTPAKEADVEKYSAEDFLDEVYMNEAQYQSLTGMLKKKKNIILQGAPGVGKTFSAKRLAYAMMGEKDENKIEMVQFHQNYSYEDFIMGYKPDGEGFKLTNGIFYRFCQKAANDPSKEYFFIIDEINRGNMSKIFGELLMLIEADYRGKSATLAYNGMSFSVPENLYIIGMMNTADRSLAMIDYALRRRFSFYTIEPGFLSDGFIRYQKGLANDTFDLLIEKVRELNKQIMTDNSLGAGFRIGHSYFCGQKKCTEDWLKDIVHYDLIPTLQEYWFDNPEKLEHWENVLCGVVDDQ